MTFARAARAAVSRSVVCEPGATMAPCVAITSGRCLEGTAHAVPFLVLLTRPRESVAEFAVNLQLTKGLNLLARIRCCRETRCRLRKSWPKEAHLMPQAMPAVFFGHGNPMNALLRNAYTESWTAIRARIPRPKAILSVSAHWYIEDAAVTVSTAPRTIHDFGGFPQELYQVQYPAPGDSEFALGVQKLLAPVPVRLDARWGLDHGTWAVLCHVSGSPPRKPPRVAPRVASSSAI
jgi:catalytic LigB subunit of aromatic ring-opening dioxygenase